MELFAGIAVILVLLLCLTGDWETVTAAVAVIAALFVLAILGFFIFFLIRMSGAEKITGRFLRIEKSGKMQFDTAIYEADGEEYADVFPAEAVFRKRIYREGLPVKLLLHKKRREVYDKNTRVTIYAGTAAFAAASALIAAFFIFS